jgi:hypothetical protein
VLELLRRGATRIMNSCEARCRNSQVGECKPPEEASDALSRKETRPHRSASLLHGT